jgi:RNA polymerase sigma-70 factor, ECF subfamily
MILAAAMNPGAFGGTSESLVRLRRGEPDALTAAISQYQHRLYRYLVRLVADPAAADDLFQQTWLLVMEKIGRYDPGRSFEAWLFSIARHLAIDYLRWRRGVSLDAADESGVTRGERFASHEPDALDRLLDFEARTAVSAAIGELPAIHREVLTLRFEEGMKLEEIAEVAGIPLATVKSRLSRALDGLRARVAERFSRGQET